MPKTFTKTDLIQAIQQENGLSLKRSHEVVESILSIIKDTLESGEDVLISGFGKFRVKEKSERKGRRNLQLRSLPSRRQFLRNLLGEG